MTMHYVIKKNYRKAEHHSIISILSNRKLETSWPFFHVWETYFFSSDENNLVIIICHVGSNIFFASVIEKFVRAILLKQRYHLNISQ